jgi:HK97 family phage major capsid protein
VKITRKKAVDLLKQIREAAIELGYEGKANDAEAIDTYLSEANVEIKSEGKAVKAKALMEVVGTLDITPAEAEVETEEFEEDEEQKMTDEDEDEEDKGKAIRAKMARTASKSTPAGRRDNWAGELYKSKAARGATGFASKESAEIFGAWARSASLDTLNRKDGPRVRQAYQESGQARKDAEILRAHFGTKNANTVDPTLGASLIAEAFDTDLILIKNDFGIARQLADVVTGFEQVHNYTVDGADVEAYWAGESQSLTEADNEFLPQRIVANKLSALGRASMEIYLKPAVAIADKYATSMLRSIYKKEDQAWIDGDGSATYGSTVGLKKRLLDLDGTPSNIDGLEIVSTDWSGVDYDSIVGLMGRVTKGDESRKKFLCSSRFFHTIMQPLKNTAAGGTTRAEIESGFRFAFEGYEVVIDNSGAMPTATGTGDIPLFFGDFALSSKMLEVSNSMRFDVSEDVYFETDEVAMKYREQVGFNIHGQGTAAEAGSYAGLYISA